MASETVGEGVVPVGEPEKVVAQERSEAVSVRPDGAVASLPAKAPDNGTEGASDGSGAVSDGKPLAKVSDGERPRKRKWDGISSPALAHGMGWEM